MTQGMKTNNSNLIKLTQLLISLSLFSFIFSPSSLFVFLHYFKFYFSTLPFQLFTHNIDKNSMFLLANGLLVFVGLTKSFSASSSDDDKSSDSSDDLSSSKYTEEEDKAHILDVEANDPMLVREDEKITSELHEQNAAAEEVVEENIENIIFIDEEQGEEMNEVEDEEVEIELFDADDEEGAKESENDYIVIEENNIDDEEEDYVEEEEEEEESCINTEELNKKFEDFIRKMKEDLRIDARRHLIMV
ncbi:glutamic acid-rich protein [Trifolium repens]|nr:glutamic acid-rich protein [Trifolium repens]